MLEDAGEDLIGNTYLLMHDVNYVDLGERSKTWAAIGSIAIMSLGAASGNFDAGKKLAKQTSDIISSYKGFSVKIRTRLYRLVWNNELSDEFFKNCFTTQYDAQRFSAYEDMRQRFCLELVGEVVSKGGRTSFLGINESEPQVMIRKACTRAIDENVVDLQRKFEPFRIKHPIFETGKQIKARIGRREGVESGSKFEVLEMTEKEGKISFRRVGTCKAIAGKIWDNRFMATEEQAINSTIGNTVFEKTSGGDFAPGMLLREI